MKKIANFLVFFPLSIFDLFYHKQWNPVSQGTWIFGRFNRKTEVQINQNLAKRPCETYWKAVVEDNFC